MFELSKSKSLNLAKIYNKAENLLNSIPAVKKKRRRRKILKALKYFGYFIIIVLLIVVIFFGVYFKNFKQVYISVKDGKRNLENAVNLAKWNKFKEASDYSINAERNFNFSFEKLHEVTSSFFVSKLPFLEMQFNNFEYLIKTAEILSRAVNQGLLIGHGFEDILGDRADFNFSKFSNDEKREMLKLIYESGPELNGIKASLDLAYLNLDNVDFYGLLWPFRENIKEFKFQLEKSIELMSKAIPMSEIIPALAGYPEKSNFLIMFQNSDELRPTGGFIGTYGVLESEDGDILNFDTHDIYHIDMPVKDYLNVAPPDPLKKYLGIDRWFMRDANWSPDWPTAAEQIEWFYEKENSLLPQQNKINNFKGEFNGIIAITPEFVTDLIAIVGPIIIEGQEYNKDNFMELLEYTVEKGYIQLGVPKWHRKEIIGDIIKELKIKLFDLSLSRWPEVIDSVNINILKKNILVFFKDAHLEDLTKDINLAGELKDFDGDYLMVVDSNMASLKTDAVISRNINYELEQGVNGLFVKLRINYAHSGVFDWKTTRYRTYTRVYVPLGSQLIRYDGLSDGKVKIKEEFGKTCFEGFISIEPGEIGSLYFEYKLPLILAKNIQYNYNLYIQKQPGSRVDKLLIDLDMDNSIKSYSPIGFYVDKASGKKIKWVSDLYIDKIFKLNFD